MEPMPAEILIFGAHPDDAEWGVGGICVLLRSRRLVFVIADLTRGELGSRGTTQERTEEALLASSFLGASDRENIGMPDGRLVDSPEARVTVASVIRRRKPAVVLAPYWEDRHPDHAAAGAIVRNSLLHCTLRKSDDPNPPHKPLLFLYYLLHHYQRPSVVIDISEYYPQKLSALRLYKSQFAQTAGEFGVIPLGLDDYLFGLESRDRFFGSLIGVNYGEGLVTDTPLSLGQIAFLGKLSING
jgi:N-acetylglucosamine malate deacetylase 1